MIFKLLKMVLEKNSLGEPPTKVGQKVTLREDRGHAPSEYAPVEGTSYECGGIVILMERSYGSCSVRWSNDNIINSNVKDFKVLSESEFSFLSRSGFVAGNPNLTFKQRKLDEQSKNSYIHNNWSGTYYYS